MPTTGYIPTRSTDKSDAEYQNGLEVFPF